MENYFYELKYTNGSNEVIVKFNADVNICNLQENLMAFLAAAQWSPANINKIFGGEDEK